MCKFLKSVIREIKFKDYCLGNCLITPNYESDCCVFKHNLVNLESFITLSLCLQLMIKTHISVLT